MPYDDTSMAIQGDIATGFYYVSLLDLRGSIPTFIEITVGKIHDVNILDLLLIEPRAVYIMDRAYVDFRRLFDMHQAQAYFVIREKQHFNFKRLYSRKVDKEMGSSQCSPTGPDRRGHGLYGNHWDKSRRKGI
jgi:hypothetical protein